MSVWTHVAAVFRIDYVSDEFLYSRISGRRRVDWDEVTGRTIHELTDLLNPDSYEERCERDDWRAYDEEPDAFVPTGSEGSLQRLVWANPDSSCAAHYTVTVFGDLRDYDDVDAIGAWFEGVCDRCSIRQAVCQVVCESGVSRTFERVWR